VPCSEVEYCGEAADFPSATLILEAIVTRELRILRP
jgi:hypothetical protein